MEVKIPGVRLLRKRRDCGEPTSASTERKLSTTVIMSSLWKASLQESQLGFSHEETHHDGTAQSVCE